MIRRVALTWVLAVTAAGPLWAFTRDEVLLYVPFEGAPEPLVASGGGTPEIKGDFAYAPGPVGQAITAGAKDTRLRYPREGNMHEREGTISIWVQSLDWTLEEKVNRWWVDVPGLTRFIIYHYLHDASVFYYHMDERREQPSIIKGRVDWQPGDWKHLAGTWKDGRLRLYVDGEKVPQESQVELGPLGDWIDVGRPDKGTPDTNLDELYVFSRALEDVEIKALYLRGVTEAEASLAVPAMAAPALDAVIGEHEYGSAAAITGFCNRVTGLLDEEQGTAWLGWDSESLYVATRWPVPEKVRANPDNYSFGPVRKEAKERDGGLDADDCVGIELGTEDGVRRAILVNASGTIADARNGDLKWNTRVRARCGLDENQWTCELAVPLADLGIQPRGKAQLRVIRTHRLLRDDEVAWPGPNPDSFAEIELVERGPAMQLTSLGRPWDGMVDLRLTNGSERPADVTISTDSGEVARQAVLSADSPPLSVRQTLADTSVTRLNVEAVAGGDRALAVSLPFCYPPVLDVDSFLYPSADRMEIILLTRGAASAAEATVAIAAADSDRALKTAKVPGGVSDERTVEVDLRDLRPGPYEARIAVANAVRALAQKTIPFEIREKPGWMGNRVGIIDYVPEPWTPLRYEGWRVSCWGRTVDLTDSLLPRQIESQGAELLAAPVRLAATIAAKEQEPGEARLTWQERSDQIGRWTSTATIGPLQAKAEAYIEFDGMMWFDVTVSAPEGPVTVEHLRLEVPLAKAHSTLLYSGDYRTIDTGLTPAEPWACAFRPCLGLSDEERGLQWFAQSRRGWRLSDLKRALEVIPMDEANVLAANIIDTPTPIAEGRTFRFGLHPTPVKPPLPGRRMIRPLGDAEKTPPPNLAFWMTHYCLGCSYPLPITDSGRKVIAERHGRGMQTHAYTRLCECSVKGPWYEYFRDEWRVHPGPRKAHKPDAEWGVANPVCPGSESWRDWTVWSFQRATEEAGYDGLYYDVSRPPSCMNREHGCGYLDEDGKWQPEVQLLATRELQKRLWVMMHEDFEGKLISHHMSGHLYMVTQSFSDIVIDGENYTSMLKGNYYELLPLDKFRAEFMGHQWGPAAAFLPEFSRAQLTEEGRELWLSAEKLPEVRHLAGMIFLHDSLPWPAYSDLTPYHTIWAAQDELGWGGEVGFLPYWDNGQYLAPMGPDLVASIFRKDDRALIVVFNNRDEAAEARLRFDLARLGVKAARLRDFETHDTFDLEDGAAVVPVNKRNFRLLLTAE